MSNQLVHVLLDVDGVLNAVRHSYQTIRDGWEHHESYVHEFGRHDGAALTGQAQGTFRIRFSPDLIGALNEIAALPNVRFHWLTTWQDEARYGLSRRVGLTGGDTWPVLGKADYQAARLARWSTETWWKLNAARAHAQANPEAGIVWIDDDLNFEREALEWVEAMFPRVLMICPETEVGLTPADIRRIRSWIETGDIDE